MSLDFKLCFAVFFLCLKLNIYSMVNNPHDVHPRIANKTCSHRILPRMCLCATLYYSPSSVNNFLLWCRNRCWHPLGNHILQGTQQLHYEDWCSDLKKTTHNVLCWMWLSAKIAYMSKQREAIRTLFTWDIKDFLQFRLCSDVLWSRLVPVIAYCFPCMAAYH